MILKGEEKAYLYNKKLSQRKRMVFNLHSSHMSSTVFALSTPEEVFTYSCPAVGNCNTSEIKSWPANLFLLEKGKIVSS